MLSQIEFSLRRWITIWAVVLSFPFVFFCQAERVFSATKDEPTHKQVFTIKPTVEGRKVTLENFCVGPRGNLWMACCSTREDGSAPVGLIMIYEPTGLLFNSFTLDFIPQAINFSPNERLYIAGSGKVARVSLGGTVEVEVKAPHLGSQSEQSDEQTRQRLIGITGIAATENGVFVACPLQADDRYGVWRMSPDLSVEGLVIKEASGCCGQLDIQSDGEHLIVAENIKFEIGIYDRNGKRLSGFGQGSSDSLEGFGSTCNPMNIRCRSDGEILTAESSLGHIKRYSRDGKFIALVGTAKVASSCKRVPIGFDSERNWYYMMNQDMSHVAVLMHKDEAPDENLDEEKPVDAR